LWLKQHANVLCSLNEMPLHRKIIHDSDCDSPSPRPSEDAAIPMTSPKRSCLFEGGVVIILSSDSEEDAGTLPLATASAADAHFTIPPFQRAAMTEDDVDDLPLVASDATDSACSQQIAPLTPLQFAGRFGRFPTPAECAAAMLAVDVDVLPLVEPHAAATASSAAPQSAPLTPLAFAGRFGRFPSPAECGAAIPAVDDDDLPLVGPDAEIVADDFDDGNLWNAVPPRSSQFMDLEAACDDTTSGSSSDCDGELTPGFVSDGEAAKENLSNHERALLERFLPRTSKYV
jgi:hypothetical protein